jgi:hypothetical protein
LSGILAAVITALALAGFAYARGGLIYSPGPLSAQGARLLGGVASHAETGEDCSACHTAPWDSATMADRCTSCHTDIAEQMRDVATVHGTVAHNDPGLGCRHCHPEHRGAEAALTVMDSAKFPHEVVGFSLNGHQRTSAREPFQCDECHADDVSTFTLETCETCHRQLNSPYMTAHTLSFGTACLDCHDGVDRFDENFDHNVFSFKLSGEHVNVACVQCHVNARGLGDFPMTLQDCYSCHHADDPHGGSFGVDCSQCHTADGWSPATFDHNLSAFTLEGKHAQVACESCHSNGQYKGTPMDCYSCHQQDDEHNGQFGTDCAACHTPAGWTPARFNREHSFPLDHGGGATCATCHASGFETYTCYGCHEHNEAEVRNEHVEEGISDFQNCMECHPTGEEHEGGEGRD